jgi:hypothetical protein
MWFDPRNLLGEESMKTNRWILVGVIGTWLISGALHAQQPLAVPNYAPPPPIPVNGDVAPPNVNPAPPAPVLSDWIRYTGDATAVRRDCCEVQPEPSSIPFYTELYFRAGASFPVGGETLSRVLKTGLTEMGGTRALFFDQAMTAAWTVDAHVINTGEAGDRTNTTFPVTVFSGTNAPLKIPNATVTFVNRTMAGVGLGREWYLLNSAKSDGCKWRVGMDFGARYGSLHADIPTASSSEHVTAVVSCAYFAAHTDVEIPTRFGLFFAGVRLEWAHSWTEALEVSTPIDDVTLLMSIGIRF